MIMYPAEYNVVYVDRRARHDRVQHREDFLPSPISSGPGSYDGSDGVQEEHEEVAQNLQCLLSIFSSGMPSSEVLAEGKLLANHLF